MSIDHEAVDARMSSTESREFIHRKRSSGTSVIVVHRLENIAKIATVGAAALALISTIYPPFGRTFNMLTAWRFGQSGYVYYAVGYATKKRHYNRICTTWDQYERPCAKTQEYLSPTKFGQLYLLKSGSWISGRFEDVREGDRLQAASPKEFRDKDSVDDGRRIFLLEKGQCVTVLRIARKIEAEKLTESASGGWLYVATSACGLFQ